MTPICAMKSVARGMWCGRRTCRSRWHSWNSFSYCLAMSQAVRPVFLLAASILSSPVSRSSLVRWPTSVTFITWMTW